MTRPYYFYKQTLLKPEVYQAQLMSKFVQGKFVERGDIVSPFFRAQVISFDPVGGNLENPDGNGSARSRNPQSKDYYEINARVGPSNPVRSLRARIITDHLDSGTADEDLRIFWPLFPATGFDPVILDFVYVFFEQNDKKHGLWVSRVPGPLGEKTNSSPGSDIYTQGTHDMPLAASHGDAPPQNSGPPTQEDIGGSKPDESRLTGQEYS